eukprot:COSAG06_NODE_35011_length_465_cov_35.057377_1_plen_24_part_10
MRDEDYADVMIKKIERKAQGLTVE